MCLCVVLKHVLVYIHDFMYAEAREGTKLAFGEASWLARKFLPSACPLPVLQLQAYAAMTSFLHGC